jgi:hypothetical protein
VIRSFSKATILALAALSATAAVNCSSNSSKPSIGAVDENGGDVGLNLDIAPGVSISSVSYTITGPNGFTKTGSIDVSNSTTISATIGGLPAGTGYTITLSATAADGGINCTGSAGFDVTARATSTVTVHLLCQRQRNTGSVLVNGTLNICPVIDSVSATDAVNGVIQVSSTASDLDNGPSPLSYSWVVVSGPGTLSSATAQNPMVTCTGAGTVNLKLTVSDGDNGTNCPDVFTTAVNCTAASTVDAGNPVTTTTTTGNGGGGNGGGGAGNGGGGAGNGGGGTTGGAGNGGGGGTVDAGTPGICTPPLKDSTVCAGCEALNCPHDATGCPANCSAQPACSDYAGGDVALCTSVLSCIRTTNCTAGGITSCYCGTAALAACQGGSANGACKSQIELGLKTTSPGTILLNLTNVALPGGGALSLGQCDHDNCGTPANGGNNECIPFCK